jgi:hypothetical protein
MAAIEHFPASAFAIPHTGLGLVEGLVDERRSTDAKVVDRELATVTLEGGAIRLDRAAVLVLDLIGLKDAPIAVRIAELGGVQGVSELGDSFAPLFDVEGDVELDERLQGSTTVAG